MTAQAWLLIVFTAITTAAGNLMIREGIARAGDVSFSAATFMHDLIRLTRQPLFDVGVFLYGLASIIWFKVISTEKLSISYPLVVAMTFFFVSIGCFLWFKEVISYQKILGMILILLGIFITSAS